MGCFCARKGFGYGNPSVTLVVACSVDGVVELGVSEDVSKDDGVAVVVVVDGGRMAGGGYRARNRVNRGGSACASLMYCRGCIDAIVKAGSQLRSGK